VLIMLDSDAVARRIEIRHANPLDDDRPPLSCGRLSAERLRTATGLIGWIEHTIHHDKTPDKPGTLVSSVHLKGAPLARCVAIAPDHRDAPGAGESDGSANDRAARRYVKVRWTTHATRKPKALALIRSSMLLARARHRYPVRRP
jgi:hypothetical protein